MKVRSYLCLLILLGLVGCKTERADYVYQSDTLKIKQLSENTFLHISYLQTETFGKVGCNGMIAIDNGEALIFDTPANDSESKELINWIEGDRKAVIKGVVTTHHHVDCLGGLNEFHSRNIPSYASNKTIELAKLAGNPIPQIGFDDQLEIQVGDEKVINEHFGEGHTKDNIVSYFPSEKVLFGGCLIKSMNASKGNLEDANIDDWSKTVTKVKAKFDDAEIVIPGHGKPGGQGLLDFTIGLFSN